MWRPVKNGSGSSSSNKMPGVYLKDYVEETSTIVLPAMRLNELKGKGKDTHSTQTTGPRTGECKVEHGVELILQSQLCRRKTLLEC